MDLHVARQLVYQHISNYPLSTIYSHECDTDDKLLDYPNHVCWHGKEVRDCTKEELEGIALHLSQKPDITYKDNGWTVHMATNEYFYLRELALVRPFELYESYLEKDLNSYD